ncbi:transposase, IS21 family [Burkholderiales bacterium GJ-E10]|nr:transposase, IS21 family [Burkholderiales bacterium GJ-E10]BAP87618.1 transposase, IS21 family [Burkholderiales bacterium GJ-E10]BAP87769.1 transposase, IS21 family [Burkholderiales bacterium GJ-E10]BAP88168.1 transposase, IS21 family [Burkholderiales bacterium GJ-E10]BAP88821.1 transposase, IS21 family [Burkholderiales bacterium GJ-E10]
MGIDRELEAQILRYYHVEKWRINTIAEQLHVHHSTVERVLTQAGVPRINRRPRVSQVDAFVPFIADTLTRFPTLTAARLFQMVRERGYRGSSSHFRHRVALLRPRKAAEAYLRLRTLQGEQGQVDWAHFGHLQVGQAQRPLMGFVMVLSYSRRIFLRFYLDARQAIFLDGHLQAFHAWNGCPRVLLYDNLKSAVLERHGDAIRFHPTLLAFAAHYRFEPRPVAVARGNEKGRVERAIRYVREAFFAARQFADIDDLNAQAQAWCDGQAMERPCPEDRTVRVRDAFAQEQPLLVPLPEDDFPVAERIEVNIGKTPYARFDTNDYSVPAEYVRRSLTVLATTSVVRIMDGAKVIASHPRSYDRGQQIEDPGHIRALENAKRSARQHRTTDALVACVPAVKDLLVQAAAHGYNLGAVTRGLMALLQRYPAQELDQAVCDALARGVPHPNAVRLALDARRHARGEPPPTPVHLPEHLRSRDVAVRPHRLDSYDQLTERPDDDEPECEPA